MGQPKHIKRYCGKIAPSVTCLTGEEGGEQAYYAYGLREGNLQELASFNVLKGGLRNLQKGNFGGTPGANVRMMPGTFVVDTTGHITYTYYNKDIAAHPEINDLITAAKATP